MSELSVTQWLDGIKSGDEQAAQKLWEGYYQKLVRLAERKLRANLKRVSDEEDVALSAMNSFCRGAEAGRFPQLGDRDDLWRLLFTITERKAIRHAQFQTRQKRGGGNVAGESIFGARDGISGAGIEQAAASAEPTPQMAMEVAENVQSLLDSLGDETLRKIALAKMEGYQVDEIATQMGCSTRSVKRRLQVIRTVWKQPDSD